MRKKQLLAFLMAGALTVGMTPAAAIAAVDDSSYSSIEEGMLETEEEIEVPVETPSAPTETPVEPEVPSEPTETPSEPEVPSEPTETPPEVPSEPTETPSEPEVPSEPTETPSLPTETPVQPDVQAGAAGELETTVTPTPTEAPKNVIMIGTTSYRQKHRFSLMFRPVRQENWKQP